MIILMMMQNDDNINNINNRLLTQEYYYNNNNYNYIKIESLHHRTYTKQLFHITNRIKKIFSYSMPLPPAN